VAIVAFRFAFTSIAAKKPSYARKVKNNIIDEFKNFGVSREIIDSLQIMMMRICEDVEK
jgi:hypothetical protein